MAELYRREFQPSQSLAGPKVNVTLQVMCAPTEEEALHLASSRKFNRVGSFLGLPHGLLPPDEAAAYPLSEDARQYIEQNNKGSIQGDPQQVRQRILEVAKLYGTTDVGIVTNCYSFEDRVRSYELVAEAVGIAPSPATTSARQH